MHKDKRKIVKRISLLSILVGVTIIIPLMWQIMLTAADELTAEELCHKNLKVLYRAFELYRADNNGYYPPSQSESGSWPDLIKKYVKGENPKSKDLNTEGYFYCPAVPKKDRRGYWCYVSYGYNCMALGGGPRKWTPGLRHHSRGPIHLVRKVPHPSTTLLLVDAEAGSQPHDGWYQAYPGLVCARHKGLAHVLFCDGHIEALTEEELLNVEGHPETNEAPWFGHLSTQPEHY